MVGPQTEATLAFLFFSFFPFSSAFPAADSEQECVQVQLPRQMPAMAVEWNRKTEIISKENLLGIRGRIIKINRANEEALKKGRLGFLMVEAVRTEGSAIKAFVAITRDTLIVKQRGKERGSAIFEDLREGMPVEIKFRGPVFMSYPIQATAEEICIIE